MRLKKSDIEFIVSASRVLAMNYEALEQLFFIRDSQARFNDQDERELLKTGTLIELLNINAQQILAHTGTNEAAVKWLSMINDQVRDLISALEATAETSNK